MTAIRKLCAVTACLLLAQSGPATARDIDMQMLIADTQQMVQDGDQFLMIWWIPNEYWTAQSQADPRFTKDMLDQFHEVLGQYVVFAVVDGIFGPFAGFTGREKDKIAAELTLKLGDGTLLQPIPEQELSQDMLNLMAVMNPLFEQMMGQFGQAMELFAFQGKDEKGLELIDPVAEGNFTLAIGERQFAWRLPLGSLLPARIDPRTGEVFPGNYKFNPYTGKKLRKQKE